MSETKRTEKELCEEALMVQGAVNLSGVVHSFSRAMTDLRVILREQGREGTRAMSEHPVSVLYASKIASLTNCELGLTFSEAYEAATKLAEEKEEKKSALDELVSFQADVFNGRR